MAREIKSDDELEQGKRGNQHALHTHGTNFSIAIMWSIFGIVLFLALSAAVFFVALGYEYYQYLRLDENKDKLIIFIEFIAAHSVSLVLGTVPSFFIFLWLRK